MFKLIIDLPDNVLGIEASGKITATDYQSVLVPALEDKLKEIKKIRFLYVLGDAFDGFSGAAAWEDAKVGLKHLTQFDRIAVVTDVEWIQNSIKFLGFAIPGEIRVFKNGDLQKARGWITEPASAGNLTFEFLEEEGVLVLHPHGELEAADFSRIASEVDPYIENKGELKGVAIVAEHFPGWDDLSALAAHFQFVKEHRQNVKRLAIVSNDRVMSTLPFLAKHFLIKESRHFSTGKKNEALAWVSQG
ncbi:MAG: STAS/SEC14 domain-containing protein [Woeseiaceae bacterium]|nr:STAS/SEC14 domain-containing protein [Woeseiaceae bacterium]